MDNKTALIAIALVGVILISGCIGTTTNNNTTTNNEQVTADTVSNSINQELIDENQTTVEIGDMI